MKTLAAAGEGGADFLVLCDTNGGTLPSEIEAADRDIARLFQQEKYAGQGDQDSASTPTMTAAWRWPTPLPPCEAGATMVQGTINGYGERCGNADLTTIIPLLASR